MPGKREKRKVYFFSVSVSWKYAVCSWSTNVLVQRQMPVILLGQRFQACPFLAMNHTPGESILWCQRVNYALLDFQDLSAFIVRPSSHPLPFAWSGTNLFSFLIQLFHFNQVQFLFFSLFSWVILAKSSQRLIMLQFMLPLHFHIFSKGLSCKHSPKPRGHYSQQCIEAGHQVLLSLVYTVCTLKKINAIENA